MSYPGHIYFFSVVECLGEYNWCILCFTARTFDMMSHYIFPSVLIFFFFLSANNYNEAKCEHVLEAMRKCCEKYHEESSCCAGFKTSKPKTWSLIGDAVCSYRAFRFVVTWSRLILKIKDSTWTEEFLIVKEFERRMFFFNIVFLHYSKKSL